jgi:hypothetical protein
MHCQTPQADVPSIKWSPSGMALKSAFRLLASLELWCRLFSVLPTFRYGPPNRDVIIIDDIIPRPSADDGNQIFNPISAHTECCCGGIWVAKTAADRSNRQTTARHPRGGQTARPWNPCGDSEPENRAEITRRPGYH